MLNKPLNFFSLLLISFQSLSQDLLPENEKEDIQISHKEYTISYSVEYKQAKWDYSIITKNRKYGKYKRDNLSFVKDPKLTDDQSAKNSSYVGTNFDKGHLTAAEDMTFDKEVMKESFFLSNASPQMASFNRGLWKKLESKVRKWGREDFDTVYIISGGILHNKLRRLNNDITIPDNFYKIVVTRNGNGEYKAIAFLMPNKPSKEPLSSFVVTIDKIEKLTKIDFFFKLRDDIENKLESETDLNFWRL
ncbi:MAG TPA: DNA/RNA non-specific endonuclease [Cytophagaceae bacterium]|jgi:endonuclease G|nr:DNA/RNA non-specific endonuclease [Cytophagaceae bacterium]